MKVPLGKVSAAIQSPRSQLQTGFSEAELGQARALLWSHPPALPGPCQGHHAQRRQAVELNTVRWWPQKGRTTPSYSAWSQTPCSNKAGQSRICCWKCTAMAKTTLGHAMHSRAQD